MMNGKKIKLTRCNKIILLKALSDYYYRQLPAASHERRLAGNRLSDTQSGFSQWV